MKRRFEFRLERVRRVRDMEERVARAERAQAESLARAAEASRDRAREVLEQSRAHLRGLLGVAGARASAALGGELEPRDVLSAKRSITAQRNITAQRIVTAQRALDAELAHLRRKIESARTQRMQAERMATAHRERKAAARALEELRERARQRHAAELEKHENAALDEVAQRLAAAARRVEAEGKQEGTSRSQASVADQGVGRPRGQ